MLVSQSCLTLCNYMNCSMYSVHGISQARLLEWIAISFSRGSSWPRDWTWVSCITGKAIREANFYCCPCKFIFSVVLGLLMIPLKEFSMSVIVSFIFSILIWLNTFFQPAESFIYSYIINIFCKILINYHYFKFYFQIILTSWSFWNWIFWLPQLWISSFCFLSDNFV